MQQVPIDRIIERITRRHPGLVVSKADVADYCYDVVTESGIYHAFREVSLSLPVNKGRVELPCNIYRLLNVRRGCDTCDRLPYKVQGPYVLVDLRVQGNVQVQALIYEVDEEGYMLVDELLERACYWYVLMEMFRDPVFQGKMPGANYQMAEQRYYHELNRARASIRPLTREDMGELVRIGRSHLIRSTAYRGR